MQKILVFLFAIIFLATTAHADVEWLGGVTQEMHLHDKMTAGNYTIEVYNFPAPVEGYKPPMKDEWVPIENVNPFVAVRLYNKTALLDEFTLLEGEAHSYNDEVRITAETLPRGDAKEWINKFYNPTARITLQLSRTSVFGKSRIAINFSMGTEFKPPSLIQLDVKVKNNGGEDAMDPMVKIQVNTSFLKKEGILERQRLNNSDTLRKDEEIIVPITYYAPLLFDSENYSLDVTAEASWMDKNRTQTFKVANTSNITITVLPQWDFIVKKSVKSEVHIGDNITVSLTIENTGINDLELEVMDTIPDGFTLVKGNLTWKPRIKTGNSWTAIYTIKPPHPMSLSLPPANATYRTSLRNYTKESNSPSLLVHGPYITLFKSLPQEAIVGSNITATLIVSNTGDRLAIVNLTDRIPEGAELVDGDINAQLPLFGGEGKTIEYVIVFQNTGTFEVPPAMASFYEQQYTTYRGVVTSEARTINITVKPTPIASPQKTTVHVESVPEESLYERLSRIYVSSIPITVFAPLILILFTVIAYAISQKVRERKILKKYFR